MSSELFRRHPRPDGENGDSGSHNSDGSTIKNMTIDGTDNVATTTTTTTGRNIDSDNDNTTQSEQIDNGETETVIVDERAQRTSTNKRSSNVTNPDSTAVSEVSMLTSRGPVVHVDAIEDLSLDILSPNPFAQMSNEIMTSIFTFLPIKEQARNKLVRKRWNTLNGHSIEQSPKKAFETTEELREAVLAYCNWAGFVRTTGLNKRVLPPPTQFKRKMVLTVYGEVINDWNVFKIKSFDYIFEGCYQFDENISSWNTSNAESMCGMFHEAASFNQSLNGWNTANVEYMTMMFAGASSFNQPLNGWNTANVEYMGMMFDKASSFDQPLNGWNTANVADMNYMFNKASSFNQPLNGWNTSNVEDMEFMFAGASSFNQPLNGWNTAKVGSMSMMFVGATSFNQPLNGWNTAKVKDMSMMFDGATSFNQPLNEWDISNVEDMSFMFSRASSFNHQTNIQLWETTAWQTSGYYPFL